jgi:hypothetical protein
MKTLSILAFAVLAFAALAAGLADVSHAATLVCDGLESGGTGTVSVCGGTRQYVYRCTVTGITQVTIGTQDSTLANYTNICAPAGWKLAIETNASHDHRLKNAHGAVVGSFAGNCKYQMKWSGPATTGTFDLAFDHVSASHDVHWDASDGSAANMGAAVGLGSGPVHSPVRPAEQDIPTLTEWGMIILVVLFLAFATVFFVRRRRAVEVGV